MRYQEEYKYRVLVTVTGTAAEVTDTIRHIARLPSTCKAGYQCFIIAETKGLCVCFLSHTDALAFAEAIHSEVEET